MNATGPPVGRRPGPVGPSSPATALLVNPGAGGGRAAQVWGRLLRDDRRLRALPAVLANDAPAAAEGLDTLLAAGGVDRLIAIGGDGTVQLAANRLLERGLGSSVPLGIVPAGTGSDLAGALGLPRRPAAALARALEGVPRQVDVLRVELAGNERGGRYVVNVASAGLSGEVCRRVNAAPRRGPASYLLAALGAFGRYRPVPCRVSVDGELLHDGELLLLAVANGRTFGNGMRVAPQALLDDGLADIVVIPPVAARQLPLRLLRFLAGRHLERPWVRWRRGVEVVVEPGGPFPPFDLDGESVPATGAALTVVPAALSVVA